MPIMNRNQHISQTPSAGAFQRNISKFQPSEMSIINHSLTSIQQHAFNAKTDEVTFCIVLYRKSIRAAYQSKETETATEIKRRKTDHKV